MQLEQVSLAQNISEIINLRGAERLKRTLVSIHGAPLVSSALEWTAIRAELLLGGTGKHLRSRLWVVLL